MRNMFYGCTSLKELDISNFKINDDTITIDMFKDCPNKLKEKLKNQKCFEKFKNKIFN